ncbi:hypothetical protein GXW74_17530 [Roseomonas eburnea]|uniref:Uncharacterized protein n=1 Tax=Neoroseomonas eburnea TaxID=1346889 RepID=A0A9X9XF11_9PROT|nr:DUF6152 family protein [Neoroseomonas eburnea]MBR0682297.1 hypothetical protein [Neoroseomonas eburnea]
MSQHPRHRRQVAAGLAMLLAGSSAAVAHHGWSWAEEEQVELRGIVREVYVGQPHPTLRVQTTDNEVWIVELGNPRQTARAGFTAASAAPGVQVVAIGHRSRAQGELRLKAVRLRIGERTYDIYPDRITRN